MPARKSLAFGNGISVNSEYSKTAWGKSVIKGFSVMTRRSIYRATTLLIFVLVVIGNVVRADVAEVQSTIDQILNRPEFRHCINGCVIRTLDTKQTIYSRNPDTLMMTASNLKLLTSAAALCEIGPDFRYSTKLMADQPWRPDGVLEGNLTLLGSGDPVFDSTGLKALIEDCKKRGLRSVNGGINADTGVFDRSPYGWGWALDYLSDYYAAPAGGLNYHKNVVNITVKPGKVVGSPAEVTLDPQSVRMRISNSVTTGPAGSKLNINRDRDFSGTVVTVSGSIAVDAKVDGPQDTVAVLDPAQYTADVFKSELETARVKVSGLARKGSASKGAVQVAEYLSKPLSAILVDLNKWSDNLIAECLLRTLGAQKKLNGSISAGLNAADVFFKKAGLDEEGINMADGSGLSRLDMVSCENFVRLLTYMYSHKYGKYWIDSLPVAGVDGTLRNRMKGTTAQGNLKAKTGFIGYVSSLSGYITTASGQPLAVSIIFNNKTGGVSQCIRAENDICVYLAQIKQKF